MIKASWGLAAFRLFRRYIGSVDNVHTKKVQRINNQIINVNEKARKYNERINSVLDTVQTMADALKESAVIKRDTQTQDLRNLQRKSQEEIAEAQRFIKKVDDFLN